MTDFDELRRNVRSSQHVPGWPENVRSISLEGLALVGLDDENRLYWDGHPIEVRRRLDLTFWQKFGAWIVGAAVVVGGIGGAAQGLVALLSYFGHH